MNSDLYQQFRSYIEYYFSRQNFIAIAQRQSSKPKANTQNKELAVQAQQTKIPTAPEKKQPLIASKFNHSFSNDLNETQSQILKNPSSDSLDSLSLRIYGCQECNLCLSRKNIVFGQGNQKSKLLIIGEAPGAQEDKEGLPFVGPAGQLLNKMLLGIAIAREAVYITNIVKCRPPSNRNPYSKEMATCSKILKKQIQILAPKLILLLGSVALQWMFPEKGGIMKNHGQLFSYNQETMKIATMATFHPAYLLRKPQDLPIAWQDFRKIRQLINRLGLV